MEIKAFLALFLILFSLFAVVGSMDYQDALEQEKVYCEMVDLWNKEITNGVSPENRLGWPPHPDFDCDKQEKEYNL